MGTCRTHPTPPHPISGGGQGRARAADTFAAPAGFQGARDCSLANRRSVCQVQNANVALAGWPGWHLPVPPASCHSRFSVANSRTEQAQSHGAEGVRAGARQGRHRPREEMSDSGPTHPSLSSPKRSRLARHLSSVCARFSLFTPPTHTPACCTGPQGFSLSASPVWLRTPSKSPWQSYALWASPRPGLCAPGPGTRPPCPPHPVPRPPHRRQHSVSLAGRYMATKVTHKPRQPDPQQPPCSVSAARALLLTSDVGTEPTSSPRSFPAPLLGPWSDQHPCRATQPRVRI